MIINLGRFYADDEGGEFFIPCHDANRKPGLGDCIIIDDSMFIVSGSYGNRNPQTVKVNPFLAVLISHVYAAKTGVHVAQYYDDSQDVHQLTEWIEAREILEAYEPMIVGVIDIPFDPSLCHAPIERVAGYDDTIAYFEMATGRWC